MAQISAIFGSGALFFSGSIGSLWPILLLASVLVALVIPMVHYFMHIPTSELVGNTAAAATEKKKEGFIEGFTSGLTLLFSRSYLLGILIVSTFYEAVAQIVEYQMQVSQVCLLRIKVILRLRNSKAPMACVLI